MLILATIIFLSLSGLILIALFYLRPKFQYYWLIASGSGFVSWLSVLSWKFRLPINFQLPRWEPTQLFLESLSFTADSLTWPFAFSVMTLIFAVILTAPTRENYPAPIPWAITLILGSFGLLAVLANNPLSLLMIWAAIDLTELVAQLRSVEGPQPSEKVITAFATRIAGIGALLWANMISISLKSPMNFQDAPTSAGLYLLLAAGLRLGVLPLHVPYTSESSIRRGFGSALRLISAASSLILLARIPATSVNPIITPILLTLTAITAVYGGWMWLRSPNELSARPFWLIGVTSLSMTAALQGNPLGAAAWGCALILSGGALFLSSVYHVWQSRALWIGVWGITALPFSLSATGWNSNSPSFFPVWPFLILAHALLLAGYIRHARHPSQRMNFETLDRGTQLIYSIGIGILLFTVLLLGFWGWEGAYQFGSFLPAIIGVFLGAVIIWLSPRLRILTPIRSHWLQPKSQSWTDWLFRGLLTLYRFIGRLSNSFSTVLEGDGGFMWTLLFLALFISLIAQGSFNP